MINSKDYNFSFSGLKTAVLYYLQSLNFQSLPLAAKQDICASFQAAATDVLVTKTMKAASAYHAQSISVSGGVSANMRLKKALFEACAKSGIKLLASPKHLSTDNAEMIAFSAALQLSHGKKPVPISAIQANSTLHL